jgi:hypothetical protein
MFCRNCGARLEQQEQFCASCGAPAYSGTLATGPAVGAAKTVATGKTRPWQYVVMAVGLLLLMRMCTAFIGGPATTPTPAPNSSTQPAELRHRPGQDVFVGYWAYRCVSARWQNSIGSEYAAQHPDARFLVVDLAIRNNDRTASTLPPVKLVDREGREYDESSKGIFMDGSFGMLKSLNPGVSSRGYVVFDVPPLSEGYVLKVSGGFGSGGSAMIDLP